MKTILEKSRAINKTLKKISSSAVDFYEMAEVLAENMECNAVIVDHKGNIMGYSFPEGESCLELEKMVRDKKFFPASINQEILNTLETRSNIIFAEGDTCIFDVDKADCSCADLLWTICPNFGGTKRIGALILTRTNGQVFTDEDIVLAEYGTIVVSNEIMRMRTERMEEDARKKAAVQIALATLSYSEHEAIENILAELDGTEGLLVASRIADKVGITRSVIVSALRKFESAGVIEARSLGMKGTHIKVLNGS
ncbi:MAG TPA: GTP-sensing pleiotropic transcriptional regulator CodY [Syntrophomonas sp.]|nr:GTP-sensing pleiotropic transcriptional regulator CodY [Syntrophomonas sp.]